MERKYNNLFDLVMNGPESRATIDRRQHTVVTNDGVVIHATETITHYSHGDSIDYYVSIPERGIGRHAYSYEEAVKIAEHYVNRANAGANVEELDSII